MKLFQWFILQNHCIHVSQLSSGAWQDDGFRITVFIQLSKFGFPFSGITLNIYTVLLNSAMRWSFSFQNDPKFIWPIV